ncbi:C6 finger domain [Mycena chlorophos]|uniref:C6 finger domain n=1 Tax=Mycena chlorophos TaxID=658473 RepID=A0A8H6TAC7_MYCCL|nr:C6 finger domain [Mycena chlorophos]
MSDQQPITSAAVLSSRRRRAMIACTNCRRRKIKCVTTEEPPRHPCQRCTKRGLSCEYVSVIEDDSNSPTPETPLQQLPGLPPPSPMGQGAALPSTPYYQPGFASYPPQATAGGYNTLHQTAINYTMGYHGSSSMAAYADSAPQYSGGMFAPMPYDPYAQGSYQQMQPRCSCIGACYCGRRGS